MKKKLSCFMTVMIVSVKDEYIIVRLLTIYELL